MHYNVISVSACFCWGFFVRKVYFFSTASICLFVMLYGFGRWGHNVLKLSQPYCLWYNFILYFCFGVDLIKVILILQMKCTKTSQWLFYNTVSIYILLFFVFIRLLNMVRDIKTKYCMHICKPGNTTINYSCVIIYTSTASIWLCFLAFILNSCH